MGISAPKKIFSHPPPPTGTLPAAVRPTMPPFLGAPPLSIYPPKKGTPLSFRVSLVIFFFPCDPAGLVQVPRLSGRHRGIASLVFSHRGNASQRFSAARMHIARIFAWHRIAMSCLACIVAHIASLPTSRNMGHSVPKAKQPKCRKVLKGRMRKVFSGLWGESPKIVSCTVRNPVLG